MRKAEIAFSQVVWWILVLALIIFVILWFTSMRDIIMNVVDGWFG